MPRPHFALLASLALLATAAVAAPTIGPCPVLPADHVFNTRIDQLPVHPQSAAFLQTISTGSRRLHLDLGQSEDMASTEYWGIPYNVVQGSKITWPAVYFDADGAPDESDCARADGSLARPCTGLTSPARLPFPLQPKVEGGISSNKAIYNDHHILSVDTDTCMLWESYLSYARADGGWDIYSSAAFDLRSNALRPAGWTSSDAAGFPIFPLLLRAEEASTGEIQHALRFTIQSSKIRTSYTWPARHLTRNGDASAAKPPMGQLFRLRADYPVPDNYTAQAKAILNALKRYGMYIADGGSDMYITGDPSRLWQDATISQVQTVPHTAFEAVDLSPITTRAGFSADSARVPPAPGGGPLAPASFSGTTEGTVQSLRLTGRVQPASGDVGQGGVVYVVAVVPNVGVAVLSPQGWTLFNGASTPAPAWQGTLAASQTVPILELVNVSSLRGTQFFLGYGTSLADMLNNAKFQLIYTVP